MAFMASAPNEDTTGETANGAVAKGVAAKAAEEPRKPRRDRAPLAPDKRTELEVDIGATPARRAAVRQGQREGGV
jgi:hypothetical protein